MDSTVDQQAAAPEEMAAISPWVLAALARPAVLAIGAGPLPTASRLWLEWALCLVDRALERALERAVELELVGPGAPDPGAAVFGAAFSQPSAGEGLIALDLESARMIVEALESDFANVRGSGALSGTEEGLLEYATLASVDQAHRDSPEQTRHFVLRAFWGEPQITPWISGKLAAAIRVRCSGQQGWAWVFLPGWTASGAPPAEDPAAIELTNIVELMLALPAVALAGEEYEHLAVGDVLLLGQSRLQGFASGCAIVTNTMWRLSGATVVEDTPTLVSATCGTLCPQVHDPPAAEGRVVVQPVMGRLPLTLEQLQMWQAGVTIELPKMSPGVELYRGLELIGRGELVQIEGELGIHLVERSGG